MEPTPRNTENTTEHRNRVEGLLGEDEREFHVFSFAKKAAAFLRNSCHDAFGLLLHEGEAHLSCSATKLMDDPFAVMLLVVIGTGIGVGHPKRS